VAQLFSLGRYALMKFSRPVWRIIIGAAIFVCSFFCAYLAQSGGIKVSFLSLPRRAVYFSSVLLAQAALVWILASLIWWIAVEIRARYSAKDDAPTTK